MAGWLGADDKRLRLLVSAAREASWPRNFNKHDKMLAEWQRGTR